MSELYIVERLRLKRAEITALRTRLSSAEAERDRLREGLRPFAEWWTKYAVEAERTKNQPVTSVEVLWGMGDESDEWPEHFRRARALLTPQAETK